MISEEDKKLVLEAQKCKDCLDWHHICKAECCQIIYVNAAPSELKESGKYIFIRQHCTLDEIWYYKLHGVPYHHGTLKYLKSNCRPHGTGVIYIRPCNLLKYMNCSGHYTKKPKLCSYLNEETAKNPDGFRVTPNCLYKYKNMEMNVNDKKEDTNG